MGVTYHGAGVLPLGEFVEYAQQVDAGEEVAPAVGLSLPRLLATHRHRHNDTDTGVVAAQLGFDALTQP